jgi:LemA protein
VAAAEGAEVPAAVLAVDVPVAAAPQANGKNNIILKHKNIKKMKKSTIIALAALGIVILFGITAYNSLVTLEEAVNNRWAYVESQYQRRSDLIPNLVSTVKGYAKHESETLENVVAARAKATQITVDAENLTPEKLQEFQAAQGAVTSALGRLLAVAENYPDLKANQNFLELQAELAGTENRIAVERNRYNEAAKEFNVAVRRFPKNIFASIFGFDKKTYFEAEEGTKTTPKVSFE